MVDLRFTQRIDLARGIAHFNMAATSYFAKQRPLRDLRGPLITMA